MRRIYFSLVSFLFLFTLINSDFSSNFRYQSETEQITKLKDGRKYSRNSFNGNKKENIS